MAWWWSWLLTAVGVFGLYLAGRKIVWAWLIGLAAQVLWIAYAIATHQYGFLVSAFAYGSVYLNNHIRWRKEEKTKNQLHSMIASPHERT